MTHLPGLSYPTGAEFTALVGAVHAAPDDDTPRLVIADWLEENGEDERAEFIRKHVELARRPGDGKLRERCRYLWAGGNGRGDTGLTVAEAGGLHAYDPNRFTQTVTAVLPGGHLPPRRHSWRFIWDRGFVRTVEGEMTGLLGAMCPRCAYRTRPEKYCDQCFNTGRVIGGLANVVRLHPVTRVGVLDAFAARAARHWHYQIGDVPDGMYADDGEDHWFVPPVAARHLRPAWWQWKDACYSSVEDARRDVRRAFRETADTLNRCRFDDFNLEWRPS